MEKVIFDIKEAAKRMGVSTAFIRRLIKEGKLSHNLIGNRYRFTTDDLEQWAETHKVRAGDTN